MTAKIPNLNWLLFIILFLLSACKLSNENQSSSEKSAEKFGNQEASAEKVIFDTDVGGDVDDAGALAVLHALADRNEIEILAIGVVIGHEAGVPFVHAVNTWYGRPELPIGTIKENAPYARDEYMESVLDEYPHSLTQQSAPDVVNLYRKVLASQPDSSVTLIVVGPATNIYNLLNSPPDEISPLNGVDLIRKKIKLYAAGGNGNGGLPQGKCGYNYYMDLEAASGELSLIPVEIPMVYAGGSGDDLKIGSALQQLREDHIIRRSYEEYYDGTARSRPTWDQLRVFFGSKPELHNLWDISSPGNITVGKDSIISYTVQPDRNRSYAYVNDLKEMRERLTELMLYDPRKER